MTPRLLLVLAVAAVCLSVVQAWRLPAGSRGLKVPATLVSSFFLLGAPIDQLLAPSSSSAHHPALQLVAPAHADFRAAQKRTYFRYTPKLLEGGEFLKSDAGAAVDKEDWAAIKKLFEVYPTKMNGSQKDQVDTTDTYVNSHYYRPMTLLAGSFAERGSSEKQRALMEQQVAIKASLDSLSASVLERRGEGLFAGMVQPPTGIERKTQAKAAVAGAKVAYNEYVRIFNEGLMLELNKLSPV